MKMQQQWMLTKSAFDELSCSHPQLCQFLHLFAFETRGDDGMSANLLWNALMRSSLQKRQSTVLLAR